MSDKTKIIETWEAQTEATAWVYTYDKRVGEYRLTRVGGPNGSRRLRISTADREYNEALIPDENQELNPFRNGRLRRIDAQSDVITDDDLRKLLETRGTEEFRELVSHIDGELTVRRLLELAAVEGTVPQVEVLRELIDDRYRVGKSQRTVLEMMRAPDGNVSDEVISA